MHNSQQAVISHLSLTPSFGMHMSKMLLQGKLWGPLLAAEKVIMSPRRERQALFLLSLGRKDPCKMCKEGALFTHILLVA